MRIFQIWLVTCMVALTVSILQAQTINNITDSGLAIHGYDPVSYHQGTPQQGKEAFSINYDGAKYLFANSENLEIFKNDPKKYEPAFGGWCAWAMLEGEKVDVDPERYKIVDGSTYLYYNTFFTDTLKKWNKLAEEKTEQALVAKANKHWKQIMDSEKGN